MCWPANHRVLALSLGVLLSLCALTAHAAQPVTETLAGREALVYVPNTLPASGTRALVVVLHGGMGNAQRIATRRSEASLNLNAQAEEHGFIVAYLNGTPVTRFMGADKLGWNAGHCCGLSAESKVDDVAYIQAAVQALVAQHGVDRQRVFGVGHSNGAMMTQRVMCETSLYAAAVPISGPLETGAALCRDSRGKRLMAIHGADDHNVPVSGGKGDKGLARVAFASEAATAKVWQNSGASYDLQIIPNADHSVDTIGTQIAKNEGQSLGQKIVKFFGLAQR